MQDIGQARLTRQQAREIDQFAINKLGISGLVLMENAGRGVVDVMERRGVSGRVTICCGSGNNGGDGFVIARHLMLRGFPVRVVLLATAAKLAVDAQTNFHILRNCHAEIHEPGMNGQVGGLQELLADSDWIVDAVLGTGSTGSPRSPFDTAIQLMNGATAKKLAIDVPSGLDCDTGIPGDPTFRADVTVTFVAPKVGFTQGTAQPFLGNIETASIGIPLQDL